jgi:hypothetical protein
VEPPHRYVQETSSSVVHHADYLNRRDDRALCGAALENPAALGAVPAAAVCPHCEAKLVEYHLTWWRETAEAAAAELAALRVKYREMTGSVDEQMDIGAELQPESTAEQDEATPASFLDQARKELLELCRRFDGTVPYRHVKSSMQAFSDRLSSDERVLLAQEIGADGSLIRWCTAEIERRGSRVANNPVSGEAEDMVDAWLHDTYQTPKKSGWRLGRRG